MGGNVFVNGDLEFGHASENASPDLLVCNVAKESLDHIEPRRTRRGEMHMESLVLSQPSVNIRGFVGGVVIHHQVKLHVLRRLAVDQFEEGQPFLVPV